jgi:hypothetical protein
MTEPFAPTARQMAHARGMDGYPFATIAHPISSNSDAELCAKAADAVRQIVVILTERGMPDGG